MNELVIELALIIPSKFELPVTVKPLPDTNNEPVITASPSNGKPDPPEDKVIET